MVRRRTTRNSHSRSWLLPEPHPPCWPTIDRQTRRQRTHPGGHRPPVRHDPPVMPIPCLWPVSGLMSGQFPNPAPSRGNHSGMMPDLDSLTVAGAASALPEGAPTSRLIPAASTRRDTRGGASVGGGRSRWQGYWPSETGVWTGIRITMACARHCSHQYCLRSLSAA